MQKDSQIIQCPLLPAQDYCLHGLFPIVLSSRLLNRLCLLDKAMPPIIPHITLIITMVQSGLLLRGGRWPCMVRKIICFLTLLTKTRLRLHFLQYNSLTGQIKHLHQEHCSSPADLYPFSLEYSLSRKQVGYWHASTLTQGLCHLFKSMFTCTFTFGLSKRVFSWLYRGFILLWFIQQGSLS